MVTLIHIDASNVHQIPIIRSTDYYNWNQCKLAIKKLMEDLVQEGKLVMTPAQYNTVEKTYLGYVNSPDYDFMVDYKVMNKSNQTIQLTETTYDEELFNNYGEPCDYGMIRAVKGNRK